MDYVVNLPPSTRPSHPHEDTQALFSIARGHRVVLAEGGTPPGPPQNVLCPFSPKASRQAPRCSWDEGGLDSCGRADPGWGGGEGERLCGEQAA